VTLYISQVADFAQSSGGDAIGIRFADFYGKAFAVRLSLCRPYNAKRSFPQFFQKLVLIHLISVQKRRFDFCSGRKKENKKNHGRVKLCMKSGGSCKEMSASSFKCLQWFFNYLFTNSTLDGGDANGAKSFTSSSPLDHDDATALDNIRPAPPETPPLVSVVSIDSVIGQGAFAVVRRVRLPGGQYIAVKTTNNANHLLKELDILTAVQGYPNIVPLVETNLSGVITMELADSDLFAMVSNEVKLPEDVTRGVFLQMIAALYVCYNKSIAHRDIKLENWLVKGDQVWLCDFGLAVQVEDRCFGGLDGRVGSLSYAAPEVLMFRRYDGHLSDMWSLCVCLFGMLHGFFPYERADMTDWRFNAFYENTECVDLTESLYAHYMRESQVSHESKDMIHKVLTRGESHRMNIHEMYSHPWIKGPTRMISDLSRQIKA
jgi:hypothetical protein